MPNVSGYLRRLGLAAPDRPGVEELADLHRAQVERIPYSSLDIHLGRACPLDPDEAVDRVARTGRAGYCFTLNAAFAALLRALGYQVREHRAWIWFTPGETTTYANHLALTVHELPTAENPGGAWMVDAGLGDAIHEPLPLLAGTYEQGSFRYGLQPAPELGGWRFRHDPAGSFTGMDFESTLAPAGAFDEGHVFLSTSPESGFVRNVIVQRRDGRAADKLINQSVRHTTADRTVEWEVSSATEWFAALADVFGLDLEDLSVHDRERLWRDAAAGQQAWREKQRA